MSGNSEEKKIYYRPVPCPAYDVEDMESWLEDLAEEGLFLTKDGFFFGFGFFHGESSLFTVPWRKMCGNLTVTQKCRQSQ